MKSLTVTYNSEGAVGEAALQGPAQAEAAPDVRRLLQPAETTTRSRRCYGNFLELRINEKRRIKRVNWVVEPDDAFDGYHARRSAAASR